MRFIAHWRDWGFLAAGIYLVVTGLTAKTLINEAESAATEEERANAKATPLKRAVVVGVGLIAVIYSIVVLSR